MGLPGIGNIAIRAMQEDYPICIRAVHDAGRMEIHA